MRISDWSSDVCSSDLDALIDLYVQHGYYKEKLISLTKKGKAGAEEIKAMMDRLRSNPPQTLGGIDVAEIKDYAASESYNLKTGDREVINLPKTEVMHFSTLNDDLISSRPSGTETKIKFDCRVTQHLDAQGAFERVETEKASCRERV